MMSRMMLLSTIAALCCCPGPALADEFKLDCQPFSLPTQARPIDSKCGAGGSAAHGPDVSKRLQNEAKNNLCSSGDPVTLTMADFMAMQARAQELGIRFGADDSGGTHHEHLPADRTQLKPESNNFHTADGRRVGEGTKVQIVGFMNEPHPGGKEDVNCEATDNPEKDVHINLVESPAPWLPAKSDPQVQQKEADRNAALCKGIVVETIPHYRPAPLEAAALRSVAKQGAPALISGQLFFDASHFPCEGSVPHAGGHPARGSLFEIHAITGIQICKHKTLAECPADNKNVWTELHQLPAEMFSAVSFDREMESEPDED
jgi:hypothetical protein